MTWDELVGWLMARFRLSYHDAEDVASEALLGALEYGRDDGPYVRGCARHAALQLFRRRHVEDRGNREWLTVTQEGGDVGLRPVGPLACPKCGSTERVRNGRGRTVCKTCRSRANREAYERRRAA